MSDLTVRLASPRELITHWQTVEPLFAAALPVAMGRYEAVDLLDMALRGLLTPWFAVDAESCPPEIHAVMLTVAVAFPRRRGLNVFLVAGGAMARWLQPWTDAVERHAREQDCDHLFGEGREGWERAVPGARRVSVQIVKDLG